MLRHLGEGAAADRVERALRAVIADGRRTTYDLGGEAGTSQFADAIIETMGAAVTAPAAG
jgi:isocitrate dehydrogenase (NAD+)